MEPQFYESERAMRLEQLKHFGRLSPRKKAQIKEQLRHLKAEKEVYKDHAKISTLEILLEVRG